MWLLIVRKCDGDLSRENTEWINMSLEDVKDAMSMAFQGRKRSQFAEMRFDSRDFVGLRVEVYRSDNVICLRIIKSLPMVTLLASNEVIN